VTSFSSSTDRALTSRGGRILVLAVLLLLPAALRAQVARDSAVDWLVSAGSEGERYLRALQVAGLANETHWSLRPFSAREVGRIARPEAAHPWAERFSARPSEQVWVRAIQPELGGILNSGFPYGFNDGPVWAGRGLTAVASAGVQGAVGPLQFVLAPQFFRAQNVSFPLAPTGRIGPQSFGDPQNGSIDLPQRFGDGSYQRLDPGQSVVRVTIARVSAGVSTANETWGPGVESPFLLSNNAAGFAHLFAGTDGPVRAGSVRLNLRFVAGVLNQSSYSLASADSGRRYMTGVAISVGIRQIPGLELGFGRLFANAWPDSGIGVGQILGQLFKNPLKSRLVERVGNGGTEADNQLGSLFARWVFPRSRVEVYGEVGKEDNSYDKRDLALEPDHDLAYLLGLQRAWKQASGSLLVLRGEVLNTSISHLDRVREQAPPYVHTPIVQGHTQIGQVLGAPAGYAGGSTSLALDWFSPRGRASVGWRRAMRAPPPVSTSAKDVTNSLSVEGITFRRRIDVAPEITLVWNENRNAAGDAFNARFGLMGRAHW